MSTDSPVAEVEFCDWVEVKRHETFGTTAYAARDIARGEVVLCEAPMLTMVGSSDASLDASGVVEGFQNVASAARVPVVFFDALMSMVLGHLSVVDVLRLEASLFSPPCALQSRMELQAVTLLLQSDAFHRCFPDDSPSFPFWRQCREFREEGAARVLKLLHACRVNVHEAFGSGFLFHKASKLAHSCNANTFWAVQKEPTPRVSHVALRPIAAGEVLSFSYIGTGLNLLMPTAHRREMLADLSFQCKCPRCAASVPIDHSRQLKCPQCSEIALALNMSRGEWACGTCGASFWKEEALARILFDERSVGTAVMQLFFGRVGSDNDARKLWDSIGDSSATRQITETASPLVQRWMAAGCASDVLGFDHYLFACGFAGLMLALVRGVQDAASGDNGCGVDLRALLEHLRDTDNPIEWTATLKRWYVRADAWFKRNVPGSAQEARSLLLFAEVLDALLSQLLLTMEEHNDLDTFRGVLHARYEHPFQRFGALCKYEDFGPLRGSARIAARSGE